MHAVCLPSSYTLHSISLRQTASLHFCIALLLSCWGVMKKKKVVVGTSKKKTTRLLWDISSLLMIFKHKNNSSRFIVQNRVKICAKWTPQESSAVHMQWTMSCPLEELRAPGQS